MKRQSRSFESGGTYGKYAAMRGRQMANMHYQNYSEASGRFMNLRPDIPTKIGFGDMLFAMKKFIFDKTRAPKGKLPEVKPELLSSLDTGKKLKFVWFGHSTLLLNLDGQIILVDPVFSNSASPFVWMNRRYQPSVLSLEQLPPVDVIVISHNHYDHLDKKTIQFFKDQKTEFIVPLGVGRYLRSWNIRGSQITELDWDASYSLSGITYTAAPAHHFSGRGLFDYKKSLWASWIIRGESEKVFYSGDSSYSDHFREIGQRFGPFDLAFIENGQYDKRWPDSHMMPEQTLQAVIDLKAQKFMPVHWGMFDLAFHRWSEPVERSSRIAQDRNITMLTPRLGEVVDTGILQGSVAWWESMEA